MYGECKPHFFGHKFDSFPVDLTWKILSPCVREIQQNKRGRIPFEWFLWKKEKKKGKMT